MTVFDDTVPAVVNVDPDLLKALRHATAATSPHVSGEAVDRGRSVATARLSQHGASAACARSTGTDPRTTELRTDAIDRGCRRIYANPTQDPRMQQ
ncbi:hypothetical protein [Streptomyces sp. NPDC056661]|uniref:hypothetical protein n=1 Tax=Streptomyces sp. NPDC056661 TaxID=3345898 RepID=UPI0036930330